jgi:hypothetical protein
MLEIRVDWQPFINAMQELSDAVAVMCGVPTSAERARQREFERRYARQRIRKARRVRTGQR